MSLSVLILTGQAGSGKTTALHTLEDYGYYCVDNMPTSLAEQTIETVESEAIADKVAIVIDVRAPDFTDSVPALFARLRAGPHTVLVLYFEALEEFLLRRYSQTRRRHPLDKGQGLRNAMAVERNILVPFRALADVTLDTSELTPHELRARMVAQFSNLVESPQLSLTFESFGFKYGLPRVANIVLDVRFLPNPYFEPSLKEMSGEDVEVRDYVFAAEVSQTFLEHTKTLLAFLIPKYCEEGKRYVTVAIGCTGGQHRSVSVAHALSEHFSAGGMAVDVRHRDISRDRIKGASQ